MITHYSPEAFAVARASTSGVACKPLISLWGGGCRLFLDDSTTCYGDMQAAFHPHALDPYRL
ncbi:MAG: hypothetical protein GX113_00030 [Actinobacteria bacterium]|jgi:hypothetical protein|nr:hypothetical protein [Actinomycetota bacterium]